MGQEEVFRVLEANKGEWFSVNDVVYYIIVNEGREPSRAPIARSFRCLTKIDVIKAEMRVDKAERNQKCLFLRHLTDKEIKVMKQ